MLLISASERDILADGETLKVKEMRCWLVTVECWKWLDVAGLQ